MTILKILDHGRNEVLRLGLGPSKPSSMKSSLESDGSLLESIGLVKS
jgi:hypothetical protein